MRIDCTGPAGLFSDELNETCMYDDPVMQRLEGAKQTTLKGGEYWTARNIQCVIGYAKWENFKSVVDRAIESCRSGGIDVRDHFLATRKMVTVGSGAKVEVEDYFLTRYACYLVAMNGDSSKAEVASAQRYFAVQTRLQELDRKGVSDRERLRLRGRLVEATKHLHSAAARAEVQNYALFHHAGYLGLYDMGLRQVKTRKGIRQDEDLYDRAGRLELSANEFKATLTEESLIVRGIKGQAAAEEEHKRVGRVVRRTIQNELGVSPEDLRAEPSIKELSSKTKRQLPDSGAPR
jgi:DNA-damage-inducible protein D